MEASIHVCESEEYKGYQAFLAKVEKERAGIVAANAKENEGKTEGAESEESDSEEEEERRWNAKKRFKQNIITPPADHLDPDSTTITEFIVWCSDGYDYDGYHSYHGKPDKSFNSIWNSKSEANERAEYLFFWKNAWGIGPEMQRIQSQL